MVERYGYTHISSGDLLRAEVASGSDRGKKLEKLMKRGILVPDNVVLDMIKEKMLEGHANGAKGYLIDGYPRQLGQGKEFESSIVPAALVLNIVASDETMKNRCLSRGKATGRTDDNEDAIKQRLKVHHEQTKPILDYYEKAGKLRNVDSEGSVDEVFKTAKKHIDKFNSNFFLQLFLKLSVWY